MDNENLIDNTIPSVIPPSFLSERDIRDDITINEGDGSLEITTDVSPVFSYVLYVNGTHLVKEVHIKNTTNLDIYDLKIRITTDNDMIEPFVKDIGTIRAGEEIFPLKRPDILAHAPALLALNESTECLVKVSIIYKGKEVAAHNDKVYVLAHSELPTGDVCDFRILASFVLPNNPAVEKIRLAATEYLKEFSGNPSFDGYQSKNKKRVAQMAAAIYYAIRQKKIRYSEYPASFVGKVGEREIFRQKIRFPDEILNNKLGTCMDLSLFYSACLEMSGLNPILITTPGHIFAGVWLTDDLSVSKQMYQDKSLIEKKVADGINELIVVECTNMCYGYDITFDEATLTAQKNLANVDNYLDIALCRKDLIKPLPIRNNAVIDDNLDEKDLTREECTVIAPALDINEIDISEEISSPHEMTKIERWERKLLDFSMHNHLLNVRSSGNGIIPLMVNDLSELENSISSGKDYDIVPQPEGLARIDLTNGLFEAMNTLFDFSDIISDGMKQDRIYSLWTENALSKTFTNLYRTSRLSIEENGVNSLYLALGILKWFDYNKSGSSAKTPHYAPIILLPIDFIRKPANIGYSISFREDDVLVNRTLLEFLNQQFEMDITGLNPPPQDENGIDVLKVLTIIRRAIMERANWNVLDCALISNFSFAQFMMWNDVHSHADELCQNKIVNSLVNGKLEWDATVPSSIDDDDALLPVPVDASQLHAIKMAANDVSFVLHGPPGTGKSQTITAMIANALYKGKTVLFVAEKQAALNVVFRRLRKIGLENFCLELHSNKVQKSHVLNQLKKSIENHSNTQNTNYQDRIQQLKEMRANLDSYVHDLHRPQKCGMSIRELIDAYESIPDYDKQIRIDKKAVRDYSQDDLDKQRELAEKLFAAGSSIHEFENNPLSNVKQTEYSQSLRREIEDFYDDYVNTLDNLQNVGNALAELLGLNLPIRFSDWQELISLCMFLAGRSYEKPSIPETRVQNIIAAETCSQNAVEHYNSFKKEFDSKYNESVLTADLDAVKAKYDSAQKKLLGKQKAMDAVLADLQQHLKIPADISIIEKIKADKLQLGLLESERANNAASAEVFWNGKRDFVVNKSVPFLEAYDLVRNKEDRFTDLLKTTLPNNEEDWIAGKKDYVETLCNNSGKLRDWIIYQSVRTECCSSGIETVCKLYEEGFEQEDILPLYFKAVYKELIWQVIDESQTLNDFSGNSFDYNIKQYRQAEADYLKLTQEELYCKLLQKSPVNQREPEISSELTLLRKAISSNGRGMSLRNLFDRIPNILTRLCPCLLMSPMSVAQYLTVGSKKFDLVIFDEASQMPTAQAIGSLARGVNAVIVGDPNQMPPTSFFSSDLTDEENILVEDLDSILEDCLALQMPDTHLLWHYRSRHESLIAFSNKNYYEGNMFTFPSVNDRARGVKVCTVNGTYIRYAENKSERGKNPKEAEAIVNEVKRRFNSPLLHNQTIGIVTFNIKQRDLIKDLIDDECKKDPKFDAWAFPSKYKEKSKDAYADEEEELFVKNLESVQGDERDVILFSIGFGPDEHGKVYYNFGPLNQEGGWKRLNVAVSRSRKEMIVFTSMTSDMIDTNRSSNDGVNQLHDFLKYAETGVLGDDISKENFHTKGITLQICKALEKAGYKTQKNIGSSDLKIDIAVINPFDEDEYLLGVLLDGDSYKKAETTRDREVSQQSVLEGLGWNTYRIWTMDWWDSKEKEISKLLEYVEKCRVKAEERAANPAEKDEGPHSEEIQPREVIEDKKEKKKKDKGPSNGDFEGRDKFVVKT